jgi:phage-related protein
MELVETGIKDIFSFIIEPLNAIIEQVMTFIMGKIQVVITHIQNGIMSTLNEATYVIREGIVSFLEGIRVTLKTFIKYYIGEVYQLLTIVIVQLNESIRAIENNSGRIIREIPEKFSSIETHAKNNFDRVQSLLGSTEQTVSLDISELSSAGQSLLANFRSTTSKYINVIETTGRDLEYKLENQIMLITNDLQQFDGKIRSTSREAFRSVDSAWMTSKKFVMVGISDTEKFGSATEKEASDTILFLLKIFILASSILGVIGYAFLASKYLVYKPSKNIGGEAGEKRSICPCAAQRSPPR